jgi:hypothetical protein
MDVYEWVFIYVGVCFFIAAILLIILASDNKDDYDKEVITTAGGVCFVLGIASFGIVVIITISELHRIH